MLFEITNVVYWLQRECTHWAITWLHNNLIITLYLMWSQRWYQTSWDFTWCEVGDGTKHHETLLDVKSAMVQTSWDFTWCEVMVPNIMRPWCDSEPNIKTLLDWSRRWYKHHETLLDVKSAMVPNIMRLYLMWSRRWYQTSWDFTWCEVGDGTKHHETLLDVNSAIVPNIMRLYLMWSQRWYQTSWDFTWCEVGDGTKHHETLLDVKSAMVPNIMRLYLMWSRRWYQTSWDFTWCEVSDGTMVPNIMRNYSVLMWSRRWYHFWENVKCFKYNIRLPNVALNSISIR